MTSSAPVRLGLASGVGLVMANMIGAGVFLSTGFMAQELGPRDILLAWTVGAVLAMAGARAYAEVAALVPRSGGEYRYLSELMHPALGYLAGWASLLVGFAAPTAIDALAVGAFTKTLFPSLQDPRWVGAGLVVLLSSFFAVGRSGSTRLQNLLVGLKISLVLGFLGVGLGLGTLAWPTWQPPVAAAAGFPIAAFMGSLFFIAFAYSGWNAAIYASEEFERPRTDVPRSMLLGCAAVAVLYLAVNFVFVANLTPDQARGVFAYDTEQVTLGHLIIRRLWGETGARAMSVVVVLVLASAMSAMIFAGPYVYAAMARDGFLPKVLQAKEGRPPTAAVLLQAAVTLVIVFTHRLQEALGNVGAILTLFTALTAMGLFRRRIFQPQLPRPSATSLWAAGLYIASAGYMLTVGVARSAHLLGWVGALVAAALVSYGLIRARATR